MTIQNVSKEETLNANIYVHAFLANAGEYEKSPHFRPENRAKVRGIVERLTQHLQGEGGTKALDFGCGTGFMIQLIHDRFSEVHGIDITQDMMKLVDLSPGNIFLHECVAESTRFDNSSFDFACAYSFMDHLFDYQVFLKEAYRILKPGGIFYSDLNPNREFASAMQRAASDHSMVMELPPVILREVKGMLHNGEHYQDQFGMDPEQLEMAEPIKSRDLGFCADEVIACARSLGFREVNVELDWFLGQAKVMQEDSAANVEIINRYLTSVLPVSSPFFKYLRFIFIK
jgi:ubiquinone/menaquinone biosynthesis C-methylase UbiE